MPALLYPGQESFTQPLLDLHSLFQKNDFSDPSRVGRKHCGCCTELARKSSVFWGTAGLSLVPRPSATRLPQIVMFRVMQHIVQKLWYFSLRLAERMIPSESTKKLSCRSGAAFEDHCQQSFLGNSSMFSRVGGLKLNSG